MKRNRCSERQHYFERGAPAVYGNLDRRMSDLALEIQFSEWNLQESCLRIGRVAHPSAFFFAEGGVSF
jgi:hypothetical protein